MYESADVKDMTCKASNRTCSGLRVGRIPNSLVRKTVCNGLTAPTSRDTVTDLRVVPETGVVSPGPKIQASRCAEGPAEVGLSARSTGKTGGFCQAFKLCSVLAPSSVRSLLLGGLARLSSGMHRFHSDQQNDNGRVNLRAQG